MERTGDVLIIPKQGWFVSSANWVWRMECACFLFWKGLGVYMNILWFPRPGSLLPGCINMLHPHCPQNNLKFKDCPFATKSAACPLVHNLNVGVVHISWNWKPSPSNFTWLTNCPQNTAILGFFLPYHKPDKRMFL